MTNHINVENLFAKRAHLINFMQALFKSVDFVVMPNNAAPFFINSQNDSAFTSLEETFLSFVNITGMCSMTLKANKYIGVQLVGARGDDENCILLSEKIQKQYEK